MKLGDFLWQCAKRGMWMAGMMYISPGDLFIKKKPTERIQNIKLFAHKKWVETIGSIIALFTFKNWINTSNRYWNT